MSTSGPINSKRDQLKKIAADQYGYFTANQATKNGYSAAHHSYHIKRRNWIRIENGLFRLPGYVDSLESDFARWYLWSRNQNGQPQGVVSHQSALMLRGLGDHDPGNVHLTVPATFAKKFQPGVVVHKASLTLSAIESRTGYLVTRLPRTLADLRPVLEETGTWRLTLEKALTAGMLSGEEALALGHESKQIPQPAPVEPEATAAPVDTANGAISPVSTQAETWLAGAEVDNDDSQGERQLSGLMREKVYRMIFQQTHEGGPAGRRAQAGFTLVELLVVVAIIGLLASLLLPTLELALDSGRSAACASNLRQIGLGSAQYESDFGRFYWASFAPRANTMSGKSWDKLLVDSAALTTQTLRCPTDKYPRTYSPARSYWCNGPFTSNTPDAASPLGKATAAIAAPSTKVLQFCHPYVSSFYKYDYNLSRNGPTKHWLMENPFGHGRGGFTNLLYCDSHQGRKTLPQFDWTYPNTDWDIAQ